jgi:flagellar M-ring protein FliF
MPPAAQLASRLTPRGWLIAGATAVAAILFIYLFVHTVSQPSYTTLVSGVQPSQTGKMTSTLSAQGIGYELQDNGTAIAVQANEASKARVALAGANLLGNTQPGFSLFEKQNLGESNFQQQVTYQRALQGQLEETIDSIQGVSGAQVELVLPSSQNQIFGENQNASSAAVLLSGTNSLDSNSVRGIAQLVSSSVSGLQLNKVTITDAAGELLWPAAGGGGAGGSGTQVQEAEQRYDQSTAASLDAMLAQTLGTGKAQVLVYANMNVDQTTKESLEYAKTGTPLAQSKSINAAAQSANGKSNYKHETTNSSLGVSTTVTHSTVAHGTVESKHG